MLIPTAPTGVLLEGSPVAGANEDGHFKLTIEVNQDRYRAGQLIGVSSTLMYVGPNAGMVVSGSGTGLVLFTVERSDPALRTEPAGTGDCRRSEIPAGIAIDHPFVKTGGWSDDDPLADFYRAYFASPELRLPAGTWTITALANFNEGPDCVGPLHDLTASVKVSVEP